MKLAAIALVLLAVVIAACGGDGGDEAQEAPATATGPTPTATVRRTQPPRGTIEPRPQPQMTFATTSAPRGTIDARQQLYNALLIETRRNVRADPESNCDPDYQQVVIELTEGTGAEKAILYRAYGDACIEAGEWTGLEYSPYHANAPR